MFYGAGFTNVIFWCPALVYIYIYDKQMRLYSSESVDWVVTKNDTIDRDRPDINFAGYPALMQDRLPNIPVFFVNLNTN